MIKFTQIPDKLKYPAAKKAMISSYHSQIIDYAMRNYVGRYAQRRSFVTALNIVTYSVVSGDSIPADCGATYFINLANSSDRVDDATMQEAIGALFLVEKNLEWDLAITTSTESDVSAEPPKFTPLSQNPIVPASESLALTPKEDLYIQPPTVPQFKSTPVIAKLIGSVTYAIYPSVPEIPTKQNEISITTDVSKMSSADLLKLYPNQVIHTRPASMYEPREGLEYDDDIGLILKINGFTDEEVRRNIIEYPHLYKLQRFVDSETVLFYTSVELDGELLDIADAWNLLPDTKLIPYTADFVKEYVVRRYLIERDHGVVHKYPLVGHLDPFLTLFAPASKYTEWGYHDVVDLARKCVESRVRYKQSRNPVLRRLNDE